MSHEEGLQSMLACWLHTLLAEGVIAVAVTPSAVRVCCFFKLLQSLVYVVKHASASPMILWQYGPGLLVVQTRQNSDDCGLIITSIFAIQGTCTPAVSIESPLIFKLLQFSNGILMRTTNFALGWK